LSLDSYGTDGVDLRSRWWNQNDQIDRLTVQFNSSALLLEAALETAIVAIVSGSRHQQVVLALGRLETDSVKEKTKKKKKNNQNPIIIIIAFLIIFISSNF
jgi:hypothetical protein